VAPRPHGDAPFPRRVVRLTLRDIDLELQTDPGLFSHRTIDTGTMLLLQHAPSPPESGHLLDLGCGYGPIALVLAIRAPRARVWAVDTDDRALSVTEENVQRAGLSNVVVCTPRAVPDALSFASIYSNPPTRIGKHALHALLSQWFRRLEATGNAYFVMKRQAGADAVARRLTAMGHSTTRIASKRGYRVLRVKPPR
jgi:16S rRNA (guanine1207-N2)-methyltransferase